MAIVIKHLAEIAPEYDKGSVLCHTINNKYMIISTEKLHGWGDWRWTKDKYSIDWWMYCDEIENINEKLMSICELLLYPTTPSDYQIAKLAYDEIKNLGHI